MQDEDIVALYIERDERAIQQTAENMAVIVWSWLTGF